MKSGFWKTDWFFGLVVALVTLALASAGAFRTLERMAYDLGVSSSSHLPSDRIAVVAIDDATVEALGQFPLGRDAHAKMVDILAGAKAKVVAITIPFAEPQSDPGYKYVAKMLEMAGIAVPAQANPGAQGTSSDAASAPPPQAAIGEVVPFVALLREAEGALNGDRRFGESVARAGNVVLPMSFSFADSGRPGKPLPDYAKRSALPASDALPAPKALAARAPTETIGSAAAALGHLNRTADADGVVRSEPLLVRYLDRLYPSVAASVAARSLDVTVAKFTVSSSDALMLGDLKVGTDQALGLRPYFYQTRDGKPPFQTDSFLDVYSGKVDAAKKFAGKIVLVGATTSDGSFNVATPVSRTTPPVFVLANSVSAILQGHYVSVPAWGWIAEYAVFALIAAYLILLLPRLGMAQGWAVTAGILMGLLALHWMLITTQGILIQLVASCGLLLAGQAALTAKRSGSGHAAKGKSDEGSAESSRMLALAYQGQGQLDMAWDKFRAVPLSDALMDNLYVLGLDFEKKRQPAKAETVFRHMAAHNPKYRDLETRLSSSKHASETVILGSAGSGALKVGGGGTAGGANAATEKAASVPAAPSTEKQMLGRYEVEKELGKGAMGVVYQGRDPKIGRVVAIKTMALAQEFEPEELAEVKERFFREAETAGRLAHQNIVTIYDAGEAQNLAFIAMELLKGGDLGPYTKTGALLPIEKVISIIARTADALGYAHKQGVVHRDIKPANIMYHLESDTVKVTDFGIARLTDSSKTKTGMVLGTPSYMSPEQLAGQKIDGRSDLFSLAGTLYQMMCGKLPFEGSSMGRLMFNISSEPPADIQSINPNVPSGVVAFLNRAMEKEPDNRFQTGEDFAAALRLAASGTATPPSESASIAVDIQL